MKPVVEKVLKSGIVDRGMVELLEKWGNLPEGASELLKNETLKDATKEQLTRFAEDLAEEVAKEHILRETDLDLDRLKWPTTVTILPKFEANPGPEQGVYHIPAMVDRMGRIYFRVQDVDETWFVPGYRITRKVFDKETKSATEYHEKILEVQPLFLGESKIAVQVTTARYA